MKQKDMNNTIEFLRYKGLLDDKSACFQIKTSDGKLYSLNFLLEEYRKLYIDNQE